LAKLSDPELYFQTHTNHLVIIDEIQRIPQLFQVLRSVIDERLYMMVDPHLDSLHSCVIFT
ncbi:MAG: hypothetical protein O7C55_07180, partial [Rickettsia endosymbiont of Ixodes persulcatus]|nr:hypothetical protein [Rickettsia endosymbiont of Ixodes persulcatus]